MKSYLVIFLVFAIQDILVTGQLKCSSNNDCTLSDSNYCCKWGCCSVYQYYNLFSSCSHKSCPGKYNSKEESYCCNDDKCCTYEKYNNITTTYFSSCRNDDSKCSTYGSDNWLNDLPYCCDDHCCSYEDKYNPVCYTDTTGYKVRCGFEINCCGSHCCKSDDTFSNVNNIDGSDTDSATASTNCYYSDFDCPKFNQSSDFVKCCVTYCCTQATYDAMYNPPDIDWSDTNSYNYNSDNTDYSSGSSAHINSRALWSILGVVGTVVMVIIVTILRYRNRCVKKRAVGRVHFDEDELLANNYDEIIEAPPSDPRPHIVAVVVETEEENEDEEPPPPYEEMI